jgi:hypothetical protein
LAPTEAESETPGDARRFHLPAWHHRRMPLSIFLLVLAAAALHASWNAIVKRGRTSSSVPCW